MRRKEEHKIRMETKRKEEKREDKRRSRSCYERKIEAAKTRIKGEKRKRERSAKKEEEEEEVVAIAKERQ